MNQTDGLPHFNDPSETGEEQGYRETPQYGALAKRRPAGEEGPYEILKAFQDYVERERQRAQRRTNTVIISFTALLAVIVIGFFAIWFSTMHGMQGTQADLLKAAISANENRQPPVDVAAAIASAVEKATENQAAAIRAAAESAEKAAMEKAAALRAAEAAAAKAAEEAAAKAREEAARARDAAEAKAREEREAATREFEARLAEERKKSEADAAAKEAALAEALKKLNDTIESVREDNDKLRKDNEALRTAATQKPAPKPAAKPAAPAKPAAQAPAKPAAPAKPVTKVAPPVKPVEGVAVVAEVTPEVTIRRPQAPAGYEAASMPLPVGEKGQGQVSWRLMLPSEPQSK